tara:strand:- start:79116 stop:79721 length:606 start_codon:yes stop_codon:yes gene_type:complete
MKTILILLSIFIFTLSCASLNKEECKSANWEKLGIKDGSRGLYEPRNESYQKDCKEFGVKVNNEEYMQGFNEGLARYCTFKAGFDLGLKGKNTHYRCEKVSTDFKKGYQKGFLEYRENLRKKEAREHAIANLKSQHEGNVCNGNGECQIAQSCVNNYCAGTRKQCVFSSECTGHGVCTPITGFSSYGEQVSISICKYNMIY